MGLEDLQGEYWFNQNWMFLGPLIALVVMARAFFNPKIASNKLLLLMWAAFPQYSIHQFEEHAYDIFGRRYVFVDHLQESLASAGVDPQTMTPTLITTINVYLVWVLFTAAALQYERDGDYIPSTVAWGMSIFNALFGHLLPALSMQKYNPGTLQSAIMLLPLGFIFARELIKVHGEYAKRIFIYAFVAGGLFVHGFVLIGAVYLFSIGVLGHIGANVWVLVWGTVAVFLPSKFVSPPRRDS